MIPESPYRYFILYKPHDMVSQFISPHRVRLLGDLGYDFPAGIHAIGRLDQHSEGLLLLTTNPKVTALLFQSKIPHRRKYIVQVSNIVSATALQQLREGVEIRIKGGNYYTTPPCPVRLIPKPDGLNCPDYEIPATIPNSWLEMELTEGKFHQVRKMVAAVRHKCRRLIRWSIESIELGNMQPGEIREMNEKEFFEQLKIHPLPEKHVAPKMPDSLQIDPDSSLNAGSELP